MGTSISRIVSSFKKQNEYSFSKRDMYFVKVLNEIEKKGDILVTDEIITHIEFVPSNWMDDEIFNRGKEAYKEYLEDYYLTDDTAFADNILVIKNSHDYVRLLFPDGNQIVKKSLLIKCSDFFSSKVNFSGRNFNEIIINTLTVETFRLFLKFLYGFGLTLTLNNCIDLYKLCDYLQVETVLSLRIFGYVKKNFVQLSKTKKFYKNFSLINTDKYINERFLGCFFKNLKDFNDVQRLVYLYHYINYPEIITFQKEVPEVRYEKNFRCTPLKHEVHTFVLEPYKKTPKEDHLFKLNNVLFASGVASWEDEHWTIVREKDSYYVACHYYQLDGTVNFSKIPIKIRKNSKLKIVDYEDSIIALTNSFDILGNVNNSIHCRIFHTTTRKYQPNMDSTKLLSRFQENFNNYTDIKLDFNINLNHFYDFAIFAYKNYIYFLQENMAINVKHSFFRFNLKTGTKEDLNVPDNIRSSISQCIHNEKLYFLVTEPELFTSPWEDGEIRIDQVTSKYGYYFDFKTMEWYSYTQPKFALKHRNGFLKSQNGFLECYIIHKNFYKNIISVIQLHYNPDDQSQWTRVSTIQKPENLDIKIKKEHFLMWKESWDVK
uniref:BTB domain-containing protein n=1 Tax=Strongyloides venezuelensis TaxID=75913 RepID=A0A0K0G2B9_STRVS